MDKLLGNCKTGRVFVISAPAGTGKTTLVNMLTNEFPCVVESVSYTTRLPRLGEINGVHYHFVGIDKFEQMITENAFLEHVKLYGYYYGTAYATVKKLQQAGKHVVLVIDTQGALLLKGKFPAVFVFLQPPSLDELRRRLKKRRTEDPTVIEERLNWAKQEIELAPKYDYCIVNDDLAVAYQVLRSIFIAEEHRTKE